MASSVSPVLRNVLFYTSPSAFPFSVRQLGRRLQEMGIPSERIFRLRNAADVRAAASAGKNATLIVPPGSAIRMGIELDSVTSTIQAMICQGQWNYLGIGAGGLLATHGIVDYNGHFTNDRIFFRLLPCRSTLGVYEERDSHYGEIGLVAVGEKIGAFYFNRGFYFSPSPQKPLPSSLGCYHSGVIGMRDFAVQGCFGKGTVIATGSNVGEDLRELREGDVSEDHDSSGSLERSCHKGDLPLCKTISFGPLPQDPNARKLEVLARNIGFMPTEYHVAGQKILNSLFNRVGIY